MSKLFDTKSGEVYVNESIVLRQNLTLNELLATGFIFNREIDMKTGWIFRTTGPHLLAGRDANLSLAFHNGFLKNISFAFVEKAAGSLDGMHKMQNQVLVQELGMPDCQNDQQIIYRFPWGEIASESDPRGGAVNIIISWK